MITLKYPFAQGEKRKNFDLIAEICGRGGVIIYPTETFYAIGGDALNAKLGDKLSQIKNRPADKPFPTLVGDFPTLEKLVAEWPEGAREIADKYWPGALTMVLPGRKSLPVAITGFDNSIAVRWSSHPLLNEIANFLHTPLISTSANLSAQPPTQKTLDLTPEILAQTDLLIIADSDNPNPHPSTIIDARTNPPVILRQGEIVIT